MSTRLENLERQVDSIIFLLKPQIKERITKLFLAYIAKNLRMDRSYRGQDIGLGFREHLKIFWKFGDIINEVFDEAVTEGTIEDRGKGWYRIKVHIGRT